jgi:hypothetical protein
MTLEKCISRIFGLDDETWMRHANPWSGWTRFTVLPLLVLAFWSRVWWGWGSLILITLALAWTFFNPRIFSPPLSTDSWISRGVLGERVWMNRDQIPVPKHHRLMPHLLSGVSGLGGLGVIEGTVALDLWPLILGFALVYLGKLWFIDRMVWLYQDMQEVPEYQAWLHQSRGA